MTKVFFTCTQPVSENKGRPGRGGGPSFLSINAHPLGPLSPKTLPSLLFLPASPPSSPAWLGSPTLLPLPILSLLIHLLSPGRSQLVLLAFPQSHPPLELRLQPFSASSGSLASILRRVPQVPLTLLWLPLCKCPLSPRDCEALGS